AEVITLCAIARAKLLRLIPRGARAVKHIDRASRIEGIRCADESGVTGNSDRVAEGIESHAIVRGELCLFAPLAVGISEYIGCALQGIAIDGGMHGGMPGANDRCVSRDRDRVSERVEGCAIVRC